ncbi:MAG: AraC family transcriptional regulator [Pseudomonadota bacterium]
MAALNDGGGEYSATGGTLASPGSRVSSPEPVRAPPPRGGLAPWQAKRIAAYVRENISSRLRASELAALAKLSDSHFSRAFKASFAMPPVVYILKQRMSVAQQKMLTTGHSLARIALECGLCDQAHFSRSFRRIVGQTPSDWRRRYAPGPIRRHGEYSAL